MSDHTTVRVDEIPPCSFKHAVYTEALYDGKIKRGPWAYMCQAHFDLHGVGLGLGKGQRLILKGAKEEHFDPRQRIAEITIAGILGATTDDVETDVETDMVGGDFIVWTCGNWYGLWEFDSTVVLLGGE